MCSLIHLKELYASNNQITCANLEGLASLEVLDLNSNIVERLQDLVGLSELQNLKSILLDGNPVVDSADYQQFEQSRFQRIDEHSESFGEAVDSASAVTSENKLHEDDSCMHESEGLDVQTSALVQMKDNTEDAPPFKGEKGCQGESDRKRCSLSHS